MTFSTIQSIDLSYFIENLLFLADAEYQDSAELPEKCQRPFNNSKHHELARKEMQITKARKRTLIEYNSIYFNF